MTGSIPLSPEVLTTIVLSSMLQPVSMWLYQLVGNYLWIASHKCCSSVTVVIRAVTNNQVRAIGSKKKHLLTHCGRQCTEAHSVDQSAQIAGKFIFSYQDGLSWHLRALHCKF